MNPHPLKRPRSTTVARLDGAQRQTLVSGLTMLVLLEAWFQQSAPDAGVVMQAITRDGADKRVHILTGLRSVLGRWAEQGLTQALDLNDLDVPDALGASLEDS